MTGRGLGLSVPVLLVLGRRLPDLVEDLEIDFNVRLPQAIQQGATVDEVRAVVDRMQVKLDRARELLKEAEASRSDVF